MIKDMKARLRIVSNNGYLYWHPKRDSGIWDEDASSFRSLNEVLDLIKDSFYLDIDEVELEDGTVMPVYLLR